jgi:hypothetical protein
VDEHGLVKMIGDSEVRLGLACSKCKGELLPITSGETITFFCDNAHETTVEQLVGDQAQNASATLQALLVAWHKNALALELLAQEARSKGHNSAIHILQKHIGTLEARIDVLKNAIDKRPPDRS